MTNIVETVNSFQVLFSDIWIEMVIKKNHLFIYIFLQIKVVVEKKY